LGSGGLEFNLRIDGLAWVLALLITAIGCPAVIAHEQPPPELLLKQTDARADGRLI